MEILDINKDIVPYTFSILLGGELYEMRIDYNNTANLFTASLSKDGVNLCSGEPINYGIPLFWDIQTRGGFPSVTIIPFDESGANNAVTYDNLSSTVMLYVLGDEDE